MRRRNHDQREEKEKKPITRHLRLLVLLLILAFVATPHLRSSLATIRQSPELYERHTSFGFTFPFAGRYYLMKPLNYDPARQYPLVIALHGVSSHAYPAEALAKPEFREKYPFFVMVPIAPGQASWATPKNKAYQMQQGFMPWPDHLPLVMAGVNSIASRYNIDRSKIIITGHSRGANGVIGALQRYPDWFAAGIASSGVWAPNEISNIKAPLFFYHGALDRAVPVTFAQELKNGASRKGAPVKVSILKDRGHGLGEIYQHPQIWDRALAVIK